jgi:hypothetical protein
LLYQDAWRYLGYPEKLEWNLWNIGCAVRRYPTQLAQGTKQSVPCREPSS